MRHEKEISSAITRKDMTDAYMYMYDYQSEAADSEYLEHLAENYIDPIDFISMESKVDMFQELKNLADEVMESLCNPVTFNELLHTCTSRRLFTMLRA